MALADRTSWTGLTPKLRKRLERSSTMPERKSARSRAPYPSRAFGVKCRESPKGPSPPHRRTESSVSQLRVWQAILGCSIPRSSGPTTQGTLDGGAATGSGRFRTIAEQCSTIVRLGRDAFVLSRSSVPRGVRGHRFPGDPRGRRVRFHPTPSRPCGSGSSKNSRLQWNVPAPVDSRNGQRKRGLVQARRWCGWPTRSTHAGHQVGYKEASPTAARGDLSGRRAMVALLVQDLVSGVGPAGYKHPSTFHLI